MKKFLIASSVAGAVGLYKLPCALRRAAAAAEERLAGVARVLVAECVSGLERRRNFTFPPVRKQDI
jgi:hypothetical protein